MRFLLDADLPRAATELVKEHGHDAVDVRDIGLTSAKDQEIARHARDQHLCLLTGDFDFSDIRVYPPAEFFGVVVLMIPGSASSRYILALLDSFLSQEQLLEELPGKLAIVEPGRVRFRDG